MISLLRNPQYIASCDYDLESRTPDTMEWAVTVRNRLPIREPSEEVIFQIGDALHALRVSLDYLAVRVVLNANTSADESKIAFPIFTDPLEFDKRKERRIPGIELINPDLFQKFVATLPYSRTDGKDPHDHPLALLDALEQPHKHRRILDAKPGVQEFLWSVPDADAKYVTLLHRTLPSGVIGEYEKAEIARFRIAISGNEWRPKAQVKHKTRFFICFDKAGPTGGEPVVTVLKRIRNHIRDVVFPIFENCV